MAKWNGQASMYSVVELACRSNIQSWCWTV